MFGFIHRGDGLERELRAARPRPSEELVSRIEGRVREAAPLRRRTSFRIAVPIALTATMLTALAAVGGVSYAANSVAGAAEAVAHVFVPDKQGDAVVISGISSGGDQYKPGFGFGDPNHNHSGPPGMKKQGGAFAPPLTPQIKGSNAIISTNFTIDEQAHLFIHVIDTTTGKELNIEQSSSKVGNKLKGGASKTVNYLVLVPRTIPIKIAVPANLLIAGHKYAVVIDAKDPQGNKSKLKIAFNA